MTSDALAELERVVIFAQAAKGLVHPNAFRPMLPHEIKAGVNFAAVDRSMRDGYARCADILDTLRRELVASLGQALAGTADGKEIAARTAQWVRHPPPDVVRARETAAKEMHAALVACAARGGEQLRAEAAHQGVSPHRVVKAAAGFVDPTELEDEASLAVDALVGKVTQAATLAAQRPSSPDAPVTAASNTSVAGAQDLARQGVHIATGEGRSAAAQELPTPTEIYASELLDDRTCDPCQAVDGTQYESMGDAEADYPNSGPYIDCDGGARCRGMLILVWDEARPGDEPLPPPEPSPPAPVEPPSPEPSLPGVEVYDYIHELPALKNRDDFDQAEANQKAMIAAGGPKADVARFVHEWTGQNDNIARLRGELAAGSRPAVKAVLLNGEQAPPLYRTLTAIEPQFRRALEAIQVGDTIDLRGVSSFTERERWAKIFRGPIGMSTDVLITVRDARGLPVQLFSNTPGEAEWLVSGNLTVTNVVKTMDELTGTRVVGPIQVEATWRP